MKYAVMEFETEISEGISNCPNKWVNTKSSIFDSGANALLYYAERPCGWSEILQAETDDELKALMEEMNNNMNDINYLDTHVYPYI